MPGRGERYEIKIETINKFYELDFTVIRSRFKIYKISTEYWYHSTLILLVICNIYCVVESGSKPF